MNDPLQEFADQVDLLAGPLLESEGMTLIDVEYGSGPKGWMLRVFIDKPGGVTIDDCVMISRQLGDLLDAKMAYEKPYSLEVSSPGLDRPLTKPKHFVYFEGQSAVIKTSRDVEGKMQLKGVLAGVSGDMVQLKVGENLISIPFETIVKAHLDSKSL
jgi:ribosome maturation factor RimP